MDALAPRLATYFESDDDDGLLLDAIVAAPLTAKDGDMSLVRFVEILGTYLIAEDPFIRAKGMFLLLPMPVCMPTYAPLHPLTAVVFFLCRW